MPLSATLTTTLVLLVLILSLFINLQGVSADNVRSGCLADCADVGSYGRQYKNPTLLTNLCAGQKVFAGTILLKGAVASGDTKMRMLMKDVKTDKWGIVGYSDNFGTEEFGYSYGSLMEWNVAPTDEAKQCKGEVKVEMYCADKQTCSMKGIFEVITPLRGKGDASKGLFLWDDAIVDRHSPVGHLVALDVDHVSNEVLRMGRPERSLDVADLRSIDKSPRPFVVIPPMRASSEFAAQLGESGFDSLRTYVKNGGRVILLADNGMRYVDVANAILGTNMKPRDKSTFRGENGREPEIRGDGEYRRLEMKKQPQADGSKASLLDANGAWADAPKVASFADHMKFVDVYSLQDGMHCVYAFYHGCAVVSAGYGKGSVTILGMIWLTTKDGDQSYVTRLEWPTIMKHAMQWTPSRSVNTDVVTKPSPPPPPALPPSPGNPCKATEKIADFVFVVGNNFKAPKDAIRKVRAALPALADKLTADGISARFALVTYAWLMYDEPMIELDYTDPGDNALGASYLVQAMENLMMLGSGVSPSLDATKAAVSMRQTVNFAGQSRGISPFRLGARPIVVLIASEASSTAGAKSGQAPPEPDQFTDKWIKEVRSAAGSLKVAGAMLTVLFDPSKGSSKLQFGDPSARGDVADWPYDREKRAQTLAKLKQTYPNSLEATFLERGLPVRTYDVNKFTFADALSMLTSLANDHRFFSKLECRLEPLTAGRRILLNTTIDDEEEEDTTTTATPPPTTTTTKTSEGGGLLNGTGLGDLFNTLPFFQQFFSGLLDDKDVAVTAGFEDIAVGDENADADVMAQRRYIKFNDSLYVDYFNNEGCKENQDDTMKNATSGTEKKVVLDDGGCKSEYDVWSASNVGMMFAISLLTTLFTSVSLGLILTYFASMTKKSEPSYIGSEGAVEKKSTAHRPETSETVHVRLSGEGEPPVMGVTTGPK